MPQMTAQKAGTDEEDALEEHYALQTLVGQPDHYPQGSEST